MDSLAGKYWDIWNLTDVYLVRFVITFVQSRWKVWVNIV